MGVITASVVLYNTPKQMLYRLVKCIEKSSVHIQLYLIDNSSVPVSIQACNEPWLHYIKAPHNGGYGAGHNIAIREVLSTAEFHFVLNPDIYFDAGELEKMIGFMKSNPAVGQLMPRVIFPDGSLQYLCKLIPAPSDLLFRRFMFGPLKELMQKQTEKFELRFTGYNQTMDIPYLSGCFMLFRISALREIGLFDERFFMYPEDIDISRRMHARFRTIYFPEATVVHDHARESYKNIHALMVHIINMMKYFNKWGWFHDPERSRVNREILRQLERMSI